MKLANIVLKLDKIGSSVPLKKVTPAEVMFLVAEHRNNAGGDPILKLEELSEEDTKAKLKTLRKELDSLEAERSALLELELTEEIRERRDKALEVKIVAKQDAVEVLEYEMQLRSMNAVQERNRLANKYQGQRVAKFYPGQMPTIPTTFEEARQAGISATTELGRLVTVGEE